MTENAYTAYYKGVQLGDECFLIAPENSIEPAKRQPLFRSPIAAVWRDTSAKVYQLRLQVHVERTHPHQAAAAVTDMLTLGDEEPGTLLIYLGNSVVTTLDDAYLETPVARPTGVPGRDRILAVEIVFVSDQPPA